MPNLVSIGLFCRPLAVKNPKFCHFLDFSILWCCHLAAVWESWTRMHNYKPSPMQWHQDHFCTAMPSWRNRVHNLWCSTAWQTDRQLAAPVAGEIRASPNLAWWQRARTRCCTLRDFGGPTHSFAARGCWKFGGIQHQLKTPITL